MTMLLKYSLQEFDTIMRDGFDVTMSDETISIISDLASQVGSSTYVKTPIFKKTSHTATIGSTSDGILLQPFKKKKRYGAANEEKPWEQNSKGFKATKFDKKDGVELQIDTIRSYLNKFSDEKYEDLKQKTLLLIDEIGTQLSAEDMLLLSKSVFDIASTNRFYSKLYATFYTELMHKYIDMKNLFEHSVATYTDIFTHVECVDPDKDYDMFCKINKENEKRKSLSMFFVNLVSTGALSETLLHTFTNALLQQISTLMSLTDKVNEINEICENLFILCNNKYKCVTNKTNVTDSDYHILSQLENLSKCKPKQYASFSNKSLFKIMDILGK